MAQQAAFEDSNISQLGSYEDIQARLAAAKTEKEWAGAGTHVGLEVWRVYDFKIHKVAPEEHGQFYSGDSYIVLNSYKAGADKFGYDVHFWLGQESSQDERGTAAYKTVELDDLLGTVPVQHREVQNHESALFLSYFKPNITLLKGGMPSGFKHVGPEKYKPRLIHVKQSGTAVKAIEVALSHTSLNTNDVFVLDVGLKIFVWNGAKCSPMEKYKGNTVAEHIQSKRNDRATIVFTSESEEDNEFWTPLGGKGPVNTVDTAPRAIGQDTRGHDIHVFRLSDKHAGHLKMEKAFTGQRPLHKAVLASDDVFIVDHPDSIFVWVGSGASPAERKNAMKFAFDYVHQNVSDKAIPITRILDGQEPKDFSALFH